MVSGPYVGERNGSRMAGNGLTRPLDLSIVGSLFETGLLPARHKWAISSVWLEHLLDTQGVTGSSPVSPTT